MSDDSFDLRFSPPIPLVNLKSVGGKFDDDAFIAGFEMGSLDCRLFQASFIQAESLLATVLIDNESQADLIAMKHNYKIESREETECGKWVALLFTIDDNILEL